MDLDLARTFLEVVSAGSLVRAAERLRITQAATSARLQSLETQLDRRLFVRNKAGARLTPAGRAFVPYATQLLQTWEQAQLKVAAQSSEDRVLSVGGEVSLWSAVLLDWLVALRRSRSNVTLRTQVDSVTRLLDRLQGGTLDIAVAYSPHRRPGVDATLLLEEELVAVSTEARTSTFDLDDYVFVDWGPDFCAQHDEAFPELRSSRTTFALGPLALRYILEVGGTGYFRTRAVKPYVKKGKLFLVQGAPTFSYSVYAVRSRRADPETVEWALGELRAVSESPADRWV